jgi:hypothetical protein
MRVHAQHSGYSQHQLEQVGPDPRGFYSAPPGDNGRWDGTLLPPCFYSLSIYIFIWNARASSQPVYTLAWALEALYQEHRILDLPYPYLG